MKNILFVFIFCFFASFIHAQERTMFVAVNSLEVKSSTGFFANTTGVLDFGSQVVALRESGKWTEARSGNISGWVRSASLSSRRITGQGQSVTAGEIALAGKGFVQQSESQNTRSDLNFSAVDTVENVNITRDQLQRFVNEGRLSRGE